jgi:dTDP-3-amino-2,3,6-trideoxy-4-keto-D-glucose/dTDP-3-amino-3,4,6-trideoxy-alpha-D-glucose/dTDP-2,6-dideoxy-D-kanosamine transaminase
MKKMIKVPYNYLPYEFGNPSKIIYNWKKLIKTSDFTIGHKVIEFENKLAKFIGVKHCISTNNGTDALILSLKSLKITKGDEIITVCNSFYATVGAIVAVGARPVLVDCDSRYQIDASKIEKAITKNTKAIIPVHWGGASPDMEKISRICKKYKIHMVEDACMGIGALVKNKRPGSFGIVNAVSMHPLKSLNVMGDGGAILTNNSKIAKWLLAYRNHGMINRDEVNFWGVNARIQPLQAIVAIEGLKKLKLVINKRKKNADILDKGLKNLFPNVIIPKRLKNYLETYALYMGLFNNRDKLVSYLKKRGIETKIHYPIPLHLQKASKVYNFKKGDFPVSEDQAKKLVTIPVHQYLNNNQLKHILKSIKDFYKK